MHIIAHVHMAEMIFQSHGIDESTRLALRSFVIHRNSSPTSHIHGSRRNLIAIIFIFFIGIHRFVRTFRIMTTIHPFQVDTGSVVVITCGIYLHGHSIGQVHFARILILHPDAVGFALIGEGGANALCVHFRHIVGGFGGGGVNFHHRPIAAVLDLKIIGHGLPRICHHQWLTLHRCLCRHAKSSCQQQGRQECSFCMGGKS